VLTLSDSGGFIHDPDGITQEKVNWVKAHKTQRRGRISGICDEFKGATFHRGKTPVGVPCDVALPCATQNELLGDDAKDAGRRTAASRCPKAPTCRPTSKACTSSRTPRSCMRRARRPTPAASRSRASR
jgi:hypothetical protein